MIRIRYGLLALWLLLATALCFSLMGCSSPTRPTARGPVTLALAGQSNAILIRPFLGEHVTAFYGEVQPIACWAPSAACWAAFRPTLRPVDAFVWSQGEYDALLSETPVAAYAAAQSDLVARVRAATGNPALLVVVLQMGPFFDGPRAGVLGPQYQAWRRSWAASDAHAVFVETAGLEYRADEVHMTDAGYAALAGRIVAAVEARR